MTDFKVVEAKPWHVGQMMRILRTEHHSALAMMGIKGHRELRSTFEASCVRKAWLIDGRLAGLGGVTGTLLDPIASVWLALSQHAMRYPVAVLREARVQLDSLMVTRRILTTSCLAGDEAALRFAIYLGFHIATAGRGQIALSAFSRRDLRRFVEETPDVRIPCGNSYAIALAYGGEAA